MVRVHNWSGVKQPLVCLIGFPAPRPYGLPSHSNRLYGAGLTGHPCPGRPEIGVLPISPLTARLFGAQRSPNQANQRLLSINPHNAPLSVMLGQYVGLTCHELAPWYLRGCRVAVSGTVSRQERLNERPWMARVCPGYRYPIPPWHTASFTM